MPLSQADRTISDGPDYYRALLSSADPSLRAPGATWSSREYAWHVADNLRIWGERIMGLSLGVTGPVSTYDPDRLAEVRGYEHLPVAAVFWSLDRAVNDWQEALRTMGDAPDLVLTHPLRGDEPISAVRRWVAHETHHHGYDIRRAAPDNSGAG